MIRILDRPLARCIGSVRDSARISSVAAASLLLAMTAGLSACGPLASSYPAPVPVTAASGTAAGAGSMYRGIPDPVAILGFDPFADYPVDETVSGDLGRGVLDRRGTPADPYVIEASGAVWNDLELSGRYVILQNGTVKAVGDDGLAAWQCEHCVIRDFEVAGPQRNVGHGSAVGLGNSSMWLRGSIHDFGDRRYDAPENDLHGIKTLGQDQWIWEANIYNMAGDSIQIGDAARGAAQRVYVAGGEFRGNRENCIDVKDSEDIVLSGFRCLDLLNPNDEFGVVIHDDAYYVSVYDGYFSNVNYGIVSSGQVGHIIDGNSINARRIGIQLRSTQRMYVANNLIEAGARCIEIQGNVTGSIQRRCRE